MFRAEIVEATRILVNACGLDATRRAIEKHWDEMTSPEARELLAYQLPRHEPHSPEHRVIETRLRALERCIPNGIEAVFSGYNEAAESILSVLNADTWGEVRRVVEANRHHLLPEVADIAFADLVMQPSTDEEQSQVLGGWNLIKQCRELGVEAAFEAQLRPSRGIILSPEVLAPLADVSSPEELSQRLAELPELAPLLGRSREGKTQAQMWDGLYDYLASIEALAAPEDLPKRIETCRAALAGIDRAAMPLVWVMVALDLADSLRAQIKTQAAPDMQEVISLYREACTILTPKGEPDQFGHAHHYLGDAYLLDASGDPAENIEAAIKAYETALGVRRRKVEQIAWAKSAANLGEALRRRVRDDHVVNIDRAVDLLGQAVEVLEASDEESLLAMARVSLGAALTERVTGSPEENLDRAAEQLKLVIEDIEPSSHPEIWAMASSNLGSLYWKWAHIDLANYKALLEQAETCFRTALDRAEAGPRVQTFLHMGLGLVLSDLVGAGAEARDEAIHHYEAALAAFEQEGPMSVGALGDAYHNLALLYLERESGERRGNVKAAEVSFRSALEAFPRQDYPVQRRDTLRALGTMYFQERQWSDAHRCFKEAIEISDEALGGCYTEPGKEAEVAKNRTLYSHAVYCLLQLGRLGEALETLEQGKARMLNESLGWKELDVSALPDERQQALRWSRDEIVHLEAERRLPDASPDLQRQARLGRQLRDAYQNLAELRKVTSDAPDWELDLDGILAEIPRAGALVAPVITSKGSFAFVVPAGSEAVSEKHIVELSSLDVSVLGELLAGRAGSGGWLNAYFAWLQGATSFDGLREALDLLASRLWEVLMGPIHKRLKELGIAEQAPVLVILSSWLWLFPIHAASRAVDGQRQIFGEDFTVSYAPSARALRICRHRLDQRQGRRLLAVANPTEDLQFAEAEVSAIEDLFARRAQSADGAVVLPRSMANRSSVVQKLEGMNYCHFACHGQFDWTNPAKAGLQLAGDEWLYLPDILSSTVDLGMSRLVTLSGCETGLSEFRHMPDEFIGLPGALLEAGAPAVISTLWSVNDISTKFLMTEFYRLHLEGEGLGVALRKAQLWLRNSTADELGLAEEYRRIYEESGRAESDAREKWGYYEEHPDDVPFKHPYYWAAFTATGDC